MSDDLEVRENARRQLALHCVDAWFAVAQAADASFERGDLDEHRFQLRVLKRIARFEAETPTDAVH